MRLLHIATLPRTTLYQLAFTLLSPVAVCQMAATTPLYARSEIVRGQLHRRCQPLVVEGCRVDSVGVRAIDNPLGALPEICQKPRNAQPRAAPISNPRQHPWPALWCGIVGC